MDWIESDCTSRKAFLPLNYASSEVSRHCIYNDVESLGFNEKPAFVIEILTQAVITATLRKLDKCHSVDRHSLRIHAVATLIEIGLVRESGNDRLQRVKEVAQMNFAAAPT